MARRTLKAGIVGKLGPRYGVRIRRRVQEVETLQRQRHSCPRCLAPRSRESSRRLPRKQRPRRRRKRKRRSRAEMYKCAVCKEPIHTNINTVGIQCERCGSKVFYKERPNVKKVVKSR
jgi:DNA-directed RNA polymerase subunit P